jgi:hypothetical protein
MLGHFFTRIRLCCNFDKKALGYILGNFSTLSSGHPVGDCPSDHLFDFVQPDEVSLEDLIQVLNVAANNGNKAVRGNVADKRLDGPQMTKKGI